MDRKPDIVLQAEGLGRSFAHEAVFANLDLTLARSSSIAIVSPSGMGKSTLLFVLGLLLDKTAGSLKVYGNEASELDVATLARHRRLDIGFIFQHTHLIGSLRVLDNVLVGANLLHRGDAEILNARLDSNRRALRERAQELLVSFGLAERLQHFPHQLSVGQKRRVAVARALLLKPPLIIADEPTNDLDTKNAEKISESLFEAVAAGHALVYATHDEDLAKKADSVIDLEKRRLNLYPKSDAQACIGVSSADRRQP